MVTGKRKSPEERRFLMVAGRDMSGWIVSQLGSPLRPSATMVKRAATKFGTTQSFVRKALDFYNFGHMER